MLCTQALCAPLHVHSNPVLKAAAVTKSELTARVWDGAGPSTPPPVGFASGCFSDFQGKMEAKDALEADEDASQDTLRLQFKAMQEMQHKRLQQQMEKRKEKELSLQSRADEQQESPQVSEGLSLFQAVEEDSRANFERG